MEQNNLTLGSLFDGSAGFPLGGLISGITPLWASEIEPFPIRVTTKRLPQMEHLGDITTLKGSEIAPVDIISFGSPCQNMSVAGKRDGLCGSQSILFYEAIRIIKEMREATNGKYPRFIVWENVPGAFSSNKGDDFKAVLEEICKVKDEQVSIPKPTKWENAGEILGDDYSVAWRLLDAQFWGVPQRRKRIYLVADFAGGCAGKILFESESVSGYSAKSSLPWQAAPGYITEGTNETGNGGLMFENHSQDTRYNGPLEVAQTVSATYGTGGNNQPFVVETSKVYGICAKDSNSMKSDNPNSGIYEADTARCLDGNGGNPACNQGGMAVVCVDQGGGKSSCNITEDVTPTLTCTHGGEPAVCLQGSMIGRKDANGPQGDGVSEDVSFTLNTVDKHAVVYAIDREAFNCGQNFARVPGITDDGVNSTLNAQGPSAVAVPSYSSSKASFFTSAEKELAGTLVATDYKDPPIVNDVRTVSGKEVFGTLAASMGEKQWLGNQEAFSGDYHILEPDYIVRRLTPTECARLQGFPDWWCDDLGTENPTQEEIAQWREIFNTHAKAMGKTTKPKTDSQIIKWLKKPHADSSEYRMWGNGVALPNVVFVLSGIVFYAQQPTD